MRLFIFVKTGCFCAVRAVEWICFCGCLSSSRVSTGQALRPGVRLILLKSLAHWLVLSSALPSGLVLLERFSSEKRLHIIVLYFIGLNVSNWFKKIPLIVELWIGLHSCWSRGKTKKEVVFLMILMECPFTGHYALRYHSPASLGASIRMI